MQYSAVAGTVNKNMDIDFLDIFFLFFIRYSSPFFVKIVKKSLPLDFHLPGDSSYT